MIHILLSLINLFVSVKLDTIWFSKNLTCVQFSDPLSGQQPSCQKWNQTSIMYYHMSYFHLCFPKYTLIQTQFGPKYIQDLMKGENILTYNHQSSQKEYCQIAAWISKDSNALSQFKVIRTSNGRQYFMSPLHNIAIYQKQTFRDNLLYKFANQIQIGNQLVSAQLQNKLSVKSAYYSQQISSLYAPLTFNSNFYIYPYGTKPQNAIKNDLILVHCYSQIKNPIYYQKYITPLLSFSEFFFSENQHNFIHPVYTKLKYLIGKDWYDQNNTVRYDISHFLNDQSSPRLQSYSIQKGGGHGGKGGSRSKSGSRSSSGRRYRKRLSIKLFSLLSIMKANILNI